MSNVWDDIYREDRWGGGSGPGSKAETTVEYRAFVEHFIRQETISTVLDVGCGDGELARLMNWECADYSGIDPSVEAIASARKKSPDDEHRFKAIGLKEALSHSTQRGSFSLAIVKDVFQHLPFAKIREVLRSLKSFRHVLVTNDIPPDGEQPDCREGDWRPVDITLPPLNVKAKEVLRFQSVPLMKKTVHIVNF